MNQTLLVSWERILKTITQRSNNFIKSILVFLLNNFIWTNRRRETKLYFLPIGPNKLSIGPNKIVQENKSIPDKILALLFCCLVDFLNPFPYLLVSFILYPNFNTSRSATSFLCSVIWSIIE